MPFRRVLLLSLVLGAGVCGPGAWAQSNPSADSITQSLMPHGGARGGMGGGTRGLQRVQPSTAPAEPTVPAPVAGVPAPHRPAAVAASPAAPSSAQAASTATSPAVSLAVQFTNGSAELTPAAVRTLTELGRALSSNALSTYRFRIEGHTDTVGSAESNKALSERRAQAVVTFLVSRFHIDSSRLDAVGMGEDGLMVQTPADTAEPRNRRVQVINLGA